MNFTFDQIGLSHLEASQAEQNGRGTGVLVTLQAVRAGIPRSLRRNCHYLDQFLWSILDQERRQAKAVWGPKCH